MTAEHSSCASARQVSIPYRQAVSRWARASRFGIMDEFRRPAHSRLEYHCEMVAEYQATAILPSLALDRKTRTADDHVEICAHGAVYWCGHARVRCTCRH